MAGAAERAAAEEADEDAIAAAGRAHAAADLVVLVATEGTRAAAPATGARGFASDLAADEGAADGGATGAWLLERDDDAADTADTGVAEAGVVTDGAAATAATTGERAEELRRSAGGGAVGGGGGGASAVAFGLGIVALAFLPAGRDKEPMQTARSMVSRGGERRSVVQEE